MNTGSDEVFEVVFPPRGGGWFKAKYEDECRNCRAPIYIGEWARMTDDGIFCQPCGEEK